MHHKNLRRFVGASAFILPIFCILGGVIQGYDLQTSISAYYHTNMRDFFVSILIITGLFLIFYKGYSFIDNFVCTISGILAWCIAYFPNDKGVQPLGIFQTSARVSDIIHSASAVIFFILLAFNSIYLFTKTVEPTNKKLFRNKIYVYCGIGMLLSMCVIPLSYIFNIKIPYKILTIEIVSLMFFGISWLVKGETIFKDKDVT